MPKSRKLPVANAGHKTGSNPIMKAEPCRPTIALIAHDGKKTQMIEFVKDHFESLRSYHLVATANTGRLVSEAGLKVKRMLSGPLGGDAQIAALVAMGECQGVIFLRDPLGMHPHDPDISSLLRICDVHNVPLATNLASAQILIRGLKRILPSLTVATLGFMLSWLFCFSAQAGPPAGPYAVATAEYKLPAQIDNEVLPNIATELWARTFWPKGLSKQKPILFFLHGNHPTCGIGENPHRDNDCNYTATGSCPAGEDVVRSHEGYNYAARLLASWGYIVVSVNANRGINCGDGVAGDDGLVLARGRLLLRHLQNWYAWSTKGGAPNSLSTNSQAWIGAVDFGNVGLMGHSRGGEGARAAYGLYQDPGSVWQSRIPGVKIRGIFEIGAVDGQSSRVLDADDTAWSQLLPMCDGDVSDLEGRLPFERMMLKTRESAPNAKSLYMVWGANHNFFNTEWQVSDSDGCNDYPDIFGPGPISVKQQDLAAQAMLAFFLSHVGADRDASSGQNFDPLYELPSAVTSITRVDRDFVPTYDQLFDVRIDDFDASGGFNSHGTPNEALGVNVTPQALDTPKHIQIDWQTPGEDHFFQSNWTSARSGRDVGGFTTLDFRVGIPLVNSLTLLSADFDIQLVSGDGSLSAKLPLTRFADLLGPGNGTTSVYQTVRIPLSSFGDFSPKTVRGVRFVFDQTPSGSINLAHLRFSKSPAPNPPSPQTTQLLASDAEASIFQTKTLATGPASRGTPTMTPLAKASAQRAELVSAKPAAQFNLSAAALTEITVHADSGFPVLDQLPRLVISGRSFRLSRYQPGTTKTLIFSVPGKNLHQLPTQGPMSIQYGQTPSSINKVWQLPNYTLSDLIN